MDAKERFPPHPLPRKQKGDGLFIDMNEKTHVERETTNKTRMYKLPEEGFLWKGAGNLYFP